MDLIVCVRSVLQSKLELLALLANEYEYERKEMMYSALMCCPSSAAAASHHTQLALMRFPCDFKCPSAF